MLYHCKAAGSSAYGTIEGWFMQSEDKGRTEQLRRNNLAGIFCGALAVLLAFATISACDVERRKSDAELGLNPQQSAGRKIYDAQCDRCHEPYSSRGKKGPSLKGVFQNKYLSLSGLPANDERVDRHHPPRPQRNARLQPDAELCRTFRICWFICTRCSRVLADRAGVAAFSWDNPGGLMKSAAKSELFRELPSVDEVLRMRDVAALACPPRNLPL